MRTQNIILLIFCLLFIVSCDKEKQQDAERAAELIETADTMDEQARALLLDSLYSTTIFKKNDSTARATVRKLAEYYLKYNLPEKAANASQRLYDMAREKNDSVQMANSHYYLGSYYNQTSVPENSLYHFIQAEKIYTQQRDSLNAGIMIHNTAKVLFSNGSYAESEILAIKALKIFQQSGNKEPQAESYTLLGLALTEMKNYDAATYYFNLALKQAETQKLSKEAKEYLKASIYNDMGITQVHKGLYNTAISLYDRALKIPGISGRSPLLYAKLLSNRAYAEMLGDTITPDTEDRLWKALYINDSLKKVTGIVAGKIRMGEFYLTQKDTAKGLDFIKQGYHEAKAIKSSANIMHALALLSVTDSAKPTYYSKEYFRINDSLQLAERATRNKFARISYETDRIEEQNKALNRRFKYMVGISVTLLLFALGFITIMRLRSRNRELLYAQEQQQANEKVYTLLMEQETRSEAERINERNRFAMELHDGIINRIFTTRFNLMQLDTQKNAERNELVEDLQETQDEIRKISHDLKESFPSESESFTKALKKLVQKQQEDNSTSFDIYTDKFINWAAVAPECRVTLFRIIEEACNNVKKYDLASNCNIALLAQSSALKLRIWDDGKGFDSGKPLKNGGLSNIKESVQKLGGTFTVTSAPGKGTTLEIFFELGTNS